MRARFLAVLAAACAACGGSGEGGGAVPAMRVSASSLSFAANAGSLTVLSQSVRVTNGGGGVLPTPIFDIAYASGSGWLFAGAAPVAGGYDVAVVASPAGLAPGTFQASLQISCPGAAGSPVSVPVELTVAGSAPILTVAPASLSFAARSGTNPAEQVVTLGNGGTGALALPGVAVSYASGSSWLQTSVTGRQAPYALHVQPIVSGLALGTYSATVQVQSPGAANSPATIAVTLLVCDPPALNVYWTPSPAPPQAGFQVPGLVAAGFPAQLACNEAGVAGVQVFVGTPLSVVPCTGTGNCVDASTWRCDLAGGGISVPLASGGTYDVEVRGLDARGNEKYSGADAVAVLSCGDTAVGAFPQGLPGTLGVDYAFTPFANCAPGSSIQWKLTRGGALVEEASTPCGSPNPFDLAGGTQLQAGVYRLDRIAETSATASFHALCNGPAFVHAGPEILLVDLPVSTAICF